jgi:phospholipid/cholesterol/gamma-HCH transport system permease protein
MISNFLILVGQSFFGFIAEIGRHSLFIAQVLRGVVKRPLYLQLIFKQFIEIGYYSLPVVGLTAIFTGAVLALQSYTGFSRFSAESSIATVVVLSVTRELGPVLAGLMVASRVGASIAAEIGTMRVTEQIEALTTLATNPIKYLVVPRFIASIIMLPCLVLVADVIGIMGGYLVAVHKLNFNPSLYLQNTFKYLELMDIFSGLVKAAVFGMIIILVSCYYGYNSKRGAQGVGIATTNAVVVSSIMILLSNYIITEIFFAK